MCQMGTNYKKAIFQDKTAEAIHGWHHTAKQNRKKINKDGGSMSMTREKFVRGSMKMDSADSMRSCEFSVTESSRSLQLSNSNLERISVVQDRARGTDSPGGGSSPHRTHAKIVEDESTGWCSQPNSLSFSFSFPQLFIGSVCRTETMHQLLRFKSRFPNHFAFTLGRYLFLLFLVHFI